MVKQVQIYTDGACSGNPGPGGFGAILLYGKFRRELSGAFPETTNNRMEIYAALAALELLKEPCIAEIYSDSSYLVNAVRKGWLANWKRNGWRKADKQEVLNRDLWLKLDQLMQTHKVMFHWVKGHACNENNNRCDELARNAITALRGKDTNSQTT